MTPLQRLSGGYYNSNPVTPANPGGFGAGGHEVNFPAALIDVATVAAAAASAAQGAADQAQTAESAAGAAGGSAGAAAAPGR